MNTNGRAIGLALTDLLVPMTDFIRGGGQAMPDVVGPISDEINQRYGTNIPVPTGGGN